MHGIFRERLFYVFFCRVVSFPHGADPRFPGFWNLFIFRISEGNHAGKRFLFIYRRTARAGEQGSVPGILPCRGQGTLFYGEVEKGRTKVNPEIQEIQYIPSRELSYEQLAEQDWQFTASGDFVEDRVVRAAMMEKLQAVLYSLSAEELALLNELFYLEKTEREVAGLYAASQNTIHYWKNRLLDKLRKMMEK